MTHLKWTRDLDTGIDVIDGQHKQIVEYINQLFDARESRNMDAVGDVIDATVDYTLSHFGFEETLMEEAGYQFVGPHKKVHQLFTKRVAELQSRYKAGEDISEELHKLLARWLCSHIRHDDASYVTDVKSRMQVLVRDKQENSWLHRSIGKFFGGGGASIVNGRSL